MNMETVMNKERLAAYADGELSPEEAAEIVMHLADHPGDQAYVENLMAANEVLAAAFEVPMHEPIPSAIHDAILGKVQDAQVIPFRRKPAVLIGTGLVLAASLTLAAVILPGLSGRDAGAERLAVGPVEPGTQIALSLDSLVSGMPEPFGVGREIMVLATLPVDGGICRELEVIDDTVARIDVGIACRSSSGWRVEVVLSEPLLATGTESGFVAAEGAEVMDLQPFLDRLGAGEALNPTEEAAAMAQGWRP